MENLIPKLTELITIYGIKIIAALAIFILGQWLAKFLSNFLKKILTRKINIDPLLVNFFSNLTYYAIFTFVVLAVLGQLGIQTSSFIAVIGAAGLAIGLALQGSLSNFAAGVLMIIFRPFNLGDYVEGAGVAGFVEEIQLFCTIIKTLDNKQIIIPNAKLASDNIINYSSQPYRLVELVFSIPYNEDLDHVKQVLADLLAEDERIFKNPAPLIAVLELAVTAVKIVIRPACKDSDYWDVYFDTNERVKKRFDAEGISFALLLEHPLMHKRSDTALHSMVDPIAG